MLTACENTHVEWVLMGLVLLKADGRMGDAWSSGQHSVNQTAQLNNQTNFYGSYFL